VTEQAPITVSIDKITLDITPDDFNVIKMALMKVAAPAEMTLPVLQKIDTQATIQAQAELDRQKKEKKPAAKKKGK